MNRESRQLGRIRECYTAGLGPCPRSPERPSETTARQQDGSGVAPLASSVLSRWARAVRARAERDGTCSRGSDARSSAGGKLGTGVFVLLRAFVVNKSVLLLLVFFGARKPPEASASLGGTTKNNNIRDPKWSEARAHLFPVKAVLSSRTEP